EIGDPQLGFIRFDEAQLVTDCKSLLARAHSENVDRGMLDFSQRPAADDETAREVIKRQRECINWFRAMDVTENAALVPPPVFAAVKDGTELFELLRHDVDLSTKLLEAEFRCLRRAKIAAWYLLDKQGWNGTARRGGRTQDEHLFEFHAAISDIDKKLGQRIEAVARRAQDPVLEFILCLYYLRSARAFAWDVVHGLARLRLVGAGAASAHLSPAVPP